MKTAVFPGSFSSLDEIRSFFSIGAKEAGFSGQALFDILLAADEAASNIIDHAYGGEGKGDIECSYQILESRLELFLKDNGKPFDPDNIPLLDLDVDLESRKPRGLGLFFMKSLMDEVNFSFNGQGGNVLRMVKNCSGSE